jgi:iron complex outermembrane receptor protein
MSFADLPLPQFDATAELALWSRNLLDNECLFYKSVNAQLGTYGIFNDPRTYGLEARLRFGKGR